jgi:hypothetical protein
MDSLRTSSFFRTERARELTSRSRCARGFLTSTALLPASSMEEETTTSPKDKETSTASATVTVTVIETVIDPPSTTVLTPMATETPGDNHAIEVPSATTKSNRLETLPQTTETSTVAKASIETTARSLQLARPPLSITTIDQTTTKGSATREEAPTMTSKAKVKARLWK